ncbi:MAG: response regulator transcription factor [Chitinispirillaceae bacterium]|nr:response regulator transcription factor [Chitinispirillaceae bacterium]
MKKILIVDDDRDLRTVMKTVLGKSYDVQEAGSAKEGLAAAVKFQPDLVLLDVMMETLSAGFDLARELRTSKKTKQAKILMITNVDKAMKIDYQSETGDKSWLPVDEYMVKPVDPKALLAKVRKLLP